MIRRWLHLLSIKSFRTKLTLVSVLCVMLPTLVTMSVYNYLTRDAVKNQAVSNARQTLKLVDGNVSNTLEYMLYLINYIQLDPGTQMLLKQLNETQYDKYSSLTTEQYVAGNEILNMIEGLTAAGEKSYLTVVLKNGLYYTNYQSYEFEPDKLLKEPWLEEANKVYGFNSYWLGTTPTVFKSDQKTNPYQLTVARPLRHGDLTIYGYVVVSILESQLHQYFQNLEAGQEVMLLDQEDRILSHSNQDKVGQVFTYLEQSKKNADPDIVHIDDVDYLISSYNIVFNGWKLVALSPYRTAISPINAIFENVFLFQVVSFVLFLILLMLALRAFTKPLLKLDKVASSVQKGELHLRSHIRGQDEIGRLGKSFDQMLDRISQMIVEITDTQARKRKAELNMLQAQINPHFLFNVLNSIRMKVLGRGDRESADMISSLSKLLRMTIQDQGNIPLHDEVEMVIDYMKLMNMRQKQKVELDIDIAADAFREEVPRFFLQPIIENALIHGLSQKAGTIRIQATAQEEYVCIRVEDNGQGMNGEALTSLRNRLIKREAVTAETDKKGFSSLGLANVYERMRMTFGESFRMEINSEPGAGTSVIMTIPKQKEETAYV
ncbi:cache domain-containing sensor histidine kinase [Paenibacillus silviterrae]|uniref:cache domain-containing sensor histidine kinase n=1 Tax=Paenibacillus silviterrae TaxID=3242194 RepID=UPI002542CFB3|nr:sensor histidine kinase [Paenibacillus chinjuensis]